MIFIKNITSIINHFGRNNQLNKAKEELKELKEAIEELQVYEQCPVKTEEIFKKKKYNVLQEMADVYVMLEQLQIIMNISDDDINNMIENKINRTLFRIQANYYRK